MAIGAFAVYSSLPPPRPPPPRKQQPRPPPTRRARSLLSGRAHCHSGDTAPLPLRWQPESRVF
ncbi:MAG: hypothetical protein OXU61_05360 [Gammaproteobacteria bacterium]|nr:hypothetical protein [Gammaproteobacteria bacterium]